MLLLHGSELRQGTRSTCTLDKVQILMEFNSTEEYLLFIQCVLQRALGTEGLELRPQGNSCLLVKWNMKHYGLIIAHFS